MLEFTPPLLNSASPWAATFEDINALYASEHTGAVTTRTCLFDEDFPHDDKIHQFVFFNPVGTVGTVNQEDALHHSSLNTLGYSPKRFDEYVRIIQRVIDQPSSPTKSAKKPFIVSVTGTAEEVTMMHESICENSEKMSWPLHIEINLSCPNIAGKPPPAYDEQALKGYITPLLRAKAEMRALYPASKCCIGIKTPPYTYMGQFTMLVDVLRSMTTNGISITDFITATNTLGSSLVLDTNLSPALNSEASTGIGGMAGAAIHHLSLGNVATLRRLLDQYEETKEVLVVGVGGVEDRAGFERMRGVGAGAVGLATALGREGVGVFGKIMETK